MNPNILGKPLTLDEQTYTLVGVMPEKLQLAPTTDVWFPMGQYSAGPDPYRYHEFNVIGRLRPGITISQAQAELTLLNNDQQQSLPATHKNFGVRVTALEVPDAANLRTALVMLFTAVALVLLVACANFVNLLMVRNAARQKEIAIRMALGAGRARVLTELLHESVLLAGFSGAVGVVLAKAGLRFLVMILPTELDALKDVGLNFTVLTFAVGISLLCGIACGLVPALQLRKLDVQSTLKDGTRTTPRRISLRQVLVISEMALAIIPMIGAVLLVRSLDHLLRVDPGFRHDHILAMELDKAQLPPAEQSRLSDEQRIAALRNESLQYDELIQRIEGLPGIQTAGGISVLPLGTALRSASRFVVEGQSVPVDGPRPVAETRGVSSGYFAAIGIPLRRGRLLDSRDYASQNIVVNEALAQKFWPAGDAIGQRINFCSLAPEPCWTTIVGVVGNVHQYGLDGAPTFDTYGNAGWPAYTVVRTPSDPATIEQEIIDEVHRFDPDLPISHVMTLDDLLADALAPRRFSTFLLSLFAALALVLATIGVYGVTSYTAKSRTNELGVRMAIGASPQNIWWLILGGGARLVLAGIAFGLLASFAFSKLISSLLYGVAATDAFSFAAAALLVALVGLFACYFPARHAMRLSPTAALRHNQ